MLALLRMISWRHLVRAPLRSALTVLGVAVGVATMVGVTALNRSVMSAFRSTIDTIAGKADLTVAGSAAGFDDRLLERVKALPGVAHASASLTAIAPVEGSPGESLLVMGVDLLDDGFFRTYQGVDREIGSMVDDLEFLNSTDRLLLSERFAQAHRLAVGDSLRLITSQGAQDFIVHALVKEDGPIKAFGGSVAVMDLASAQEAFHRGRTIDRIDVAVDPKLGFDAVQASLRQRLGPSFEVERPSRRGGSVEKMVLSFQMGLNLGSGVALLVGVFLVYNTVAIGVVQRRREIGALRALGATRLALRALFTLEAMLMGLFGTAIGLPLGALVARAAIAGVSQTISSLYVQVNARDVHVGPTEIALGLLLGVFGSVFAALRPAMHASRVQPVEAMRRDVAAGADIAGLRSVPLVAGFVLLAAAGPLTLVPAPVENLPVGGYLSIFAIMMGTSLISPLLLRWLQRVFQLPAEAALGVSGRLAADNFARAPARTAVPVSALAIGVAMTVCIAGFVRSFQKSSEAWIDQSVPADLFVTSSSKMAGVKNAPMKPALGDELEKLDGVDHLDRVRIFAHEVLDLRVYLISNLPEVYYTRAKPTFLEGKALTPEDRRNRKVIISENLMRRRDLHVGSTFPMTTALGVVTFTVGGVIVDYTSDQGTVFMDRRVFNELFKEDLVDTFEIYLKRPEDLERVRQEVTRRFGSQYDLYVLSNRELRQEAHDLIESAFGVTYAMEGVAVLLALLGVINTLLAAVIDRTREVGLLRAVGASKGHIVRLFCAEAGLIGLAGGAIGVAAGTLMGVVVTRVVGGQSTGWSFPFAFPWGLAAQMVTAATLCAIAAGLYPARRAAGLDVVEALSYE